MVLGKVALFNRARESFCLKPEHPFINLFPDYLSTSQVAVLG